MEAKKPLEKKMELSSDLGKRTDDREAAGVRDLRLVQCAGLGLALGQDASARKFCACIWTRGQGEGTEQTKGATHGRSSLAR